MALWLLQYTTINSCCKPKSPTKPLSQIASFNAFVATMYSTLVIDNETIDYKVVFQLITLPDKVNTYKLEIFLYPNLQHN